MAVTNNNIPIIDLPLWQVLQPSPAGATAAASPGVMCTDKRGTRRFIYMLHSQTSFWRYDVRANTWQQLASPPAGTTGAGTALVYDPSRNWVWALISNGSAAPTWQYYDPTTNTWTARSVSGLPATFGTDASLEHTCTDYSASGNDDYIYLIGNNATTFYQYSVTSNSWTTLTACSSGSGAGCCLLWQPGWDANRLVRVRGSNTNTMDYYSIGTPGWTGLTINPATETFGTGTMAIERGIDTTKIFIQRNNDMRIYQLDLSTGSLEPFATQFLVPTGAVLVGDRMMYIKEPTTGIEFLYIGLHTSANLLRMPLFF